MHNEASLPEHTDLIGDAMSALADGQLEGDALATALDQLLMSSAAQETWHAYHLIGDLLRSPDLIEHTPHQLFLTGLRQRLASEGQAPSKMNLDFSDVVVPTGRVAVSANQVVAQAAYLVDRQLGGSVRVEHRCLVNVVLQTSEGCLDG